MTASQYEKNLDVAGKTFTYYDMQAAEKICGRDISSLPSSLKVLMENLLRNLDGNVVKEEDIKALGTWLDQKKSNHEINYHPARVLMQDFTGVPAVVDLAAMREAMKTLGEDPQKINPLTPVDLVIDHSLMVEKFANDSAFKDNVEIEYQRNQERYEFLKWGQTAFDNFRVVPPGTGICHQVNLEYLAKVVWTKESNGKTMAYPDTLVGTDSHTTMINGLSVLGWGVGGIEAEAAMLGQAVTMLIPEVIGFKLEGKLKEGITATDLVLTVVQKLRGKGVVGKFVEFFGPGLDELSLADRATLANMAPEYGATCGFFPIDKETIRYMKFTGRDEQETELVEAYAKAQGMWRGPNSPDPVFTDVVTLDLGEVVPCIAGHKRPQDRITLDQAAEEFKRIATEELNISDLEKGEAVAGTDYEFNHGDIAIAAITSCTNTSNPSVLIAAGLVAKKANAKGLKTKPWVKTSLAPGSQVVTDYLIEAGLQHELDEQGFHLVGYGCTTCIGNSGPLPENIAKAIEKGNIVATSVLSGNRNFEGRINPHVQANFLASPPLVVAYALVGNLNVDLSKDSLGKDKDGKDVYLKDLWPSNQEIAETMAKALSPEMFKSRYSNVFKGDEGWQKVKIAELATFAWDEKSTYIKHPTFFAGIKKDPPPLIDVYEARILAILGDSTTTDHISPAGNIKTDGPAGEYLKSHGVAIHDFNSYGSRRGNHEVMMRGTFANIRIKNEMMGGKEGGYTKKMPEGKETSIYDAAMEYIKEKTPLVVIAGKEYGTGSSRDWAAKGTKLLGVSAVIAESFERIHRSNLIGMGVLPLQFAGGASRASLKLDGSELVTIKGIASGLKPRSTLKATIKRTDGSEETFDALVRLDTENEFQYFRNEGILHFVLRKLL